MSICSTIYTGLCSSLLHVGLDIEIGEHDEEHGPMEEDDVAVVLWEITVYEQRKGGVDKESGELRQLHRRQISRNMKG